MEHLTIQEIKERFKRKQFDTKDLERLRIDKRKGVQRLLKTYEHQLKAKEKLKQKFFEMTFYERKYYKEKKRFIVGLDEAGRGPLAGPVVAAAVILPEDFQLLGLTDSKQLSAQQREKFFHEITNQAIDYGVSIVSNEIIDQLNIYEATKRAMTEALLKLKSPIDHVLIDAVPLEGIPYPADVLIKGDEKSISIAAASILAKVTRDQWMDTLDDKYPMYGFKNHKGYGTKEHIDRLHIYGISPYHRKSFRPVQKIFNKK